MLEGKEIIEAMTKNVTGVGIAAMGGLSHYIYKVSKGEAFSFARLFVNIVLAGWVGYLCQEMGLSAVFISISGFCTYPILTMIEDRGAKLITDILLKK